MITDKTRRAIKELADEGTFNNCNTEYGLIEMVNQMVFAGIEEKEAVRLLTRICDVWNEEIG